MKKYIAIAVLMLGFSTLSHAMMTAEAVYEDCKVYVQTNGDANKVQADLCLGFVAGAMDELDGEMFFINDERTKMGLGSWQSVGPVQMIKVFVKFVDANPEALNKSAVSVIRVAAEQAGLFKYTPLQKPVVTSNN